MYYIIGLSFATDGKEEKVHNKNSHNEDVQEIERFIRTVRERVKAIVNTLPFEQYPK